MSNLAQVFGKAALSVRETLGITQREMAALIDPKTTSGTVSRWELGATSHLPTARALFKYGVIASQTPSLHHVLPAFAILAHELLDLPTNAFVAAVLVAAEVTDGSAPRTFSKAAKQATELLAE